MFDWNVPKEWFVKKAYIITPKGNKICDYSKNNLHLIGYSAPFNGEINLKDLKKHLYTLLINLMLFHTLQVIIKKDGDFAFHMMSIRI